MKVGPPTSVRSRGHGLNAPLGLSPELTGGSDDRHASRYDRSGEAGAPPDTFDRQPPQDLTAEQSVLGGMLLSKDA
ncbi:hypothetical protein FVA95_27630, partial [Pseudonocardia sp. EV170527-09]|uniref:hypothetical protein n=1 Tax=Pseudonocardia sp. EV170527-09 TaxID=2603411 RepID=UPI00125538FD